MASSLKFDLLITIASADYSATLATVCGLLFIASLLLHSVNFFLTSEFSRECALVMRRECVTGFGTLPLP